MMRTLKSGIGEEHMQSIKGKTAVIVSCFVVLIVINVIAFIVPFHRLGSFWIGYGFTTFTVIFCFAASLYALRGENIRSRFYGLPIPALLLSYLLIQTVLGIVFMSFSTIRTWISLTISIVLAAFYILGVIALDASKEHAERYDREIGAKQFYIESIKVKIDMVKEKTDDMLLKERLEKLAEDFNYSDPMSADELSTLEREIENNVDILSKKVDDGEYQAASHMCESIKLQLIERNKKCKMLK